MRPFPWRLLGGASLVRLVVGTALAIAGAAAPAAAQARPTPPSTPTAPPPTPDRPRTPPTAPGAAGNPAAGVPADSARRAGGVPARPLPADTALRLRADTLRRAHPDSLRADSLHRDSLRTDTLGRAAPPRAVVGDSAARADTASPFGDLDVRLVGRMESKLERARNERCARGQQFAVAFGCNGGFQPNFDFQFNVQTSGAIAERLHLNVDYDSQREFDASNVISAFYAAKDERARLGRVEVGNVSFVPPPSRFITSGIPSNNYGIQALGRLGPMRWRTIAAQQRGNVVRDRVFTVGDRAVQTVERTLDDFQIEPRRFFFTVDPRLLPGWPNVDVLNRAEMAQRALALPDTLRPTRVRLYRQLIGAANQNPRGPRLLVRGAKNDRVRQTYELLREGVDYYLDPSQLWFALLRPLGLNNERLAVAYEVTIGGQRTRHVSTGGTPDAEFTDADQFANLVWEPELSPSDSAFHREMRNVYRIGGDEVRRETVALRIVTGPGADQEKPIDASQGATYLQLFGLAQAANPTTFDVENRLWPRPQDPNYLFTGAGQGTRLLRDYFVVFPSLQPFARAGLARPAANPANDTLYTFPNEFLYSAQRPQSIYRLRATYESEGGPDASTIALGAVQLRQGSERLVARGRQLVRDVDYTIDYDIGTVTFLRPDTLFPTPTPVTVRFEENPLFAVQPTRVLGAAAEFPTAAGTIAFTAISQSQSSTFNRPPLGFEPVGSIVAGVSADLAWDAPLLSRWAGALSFGARRGPAAPGPLPSSRIALRGELAASRPVSLADGKAYVESFEGEGGIGVSLTESNWYLSSRPAPGSALRAPLDGLPLGLDRASTLVWQSAARARVGGRDSLLAFPITAIDPAVRLTSGGYRPSEPLLWLTLFPLSVGGQAAASTTAVPPFRWTVAGAPAGRRWRSVRTVLNPGGADLSRVESLEFYALVRTDDAGLGRNPTLVFDLGEISENSVAFAPETLTVARRATSGGATVVDSAYGGKQRQGYDRIDSERDTLSRVFNASVNDRGLPGDRVERLVVVDRTGGAPATRVDTNVTLCVALPGATRPLGDPQVDCTARNNRLDEEDIDQDGTLNMRDAEVDRERVRRFVVDLSRRSAWVREGGCTRAVAALGGTAGTEQKCWVLVRVPFRAPTEAVGAFNERRVRALRLTMLSGRDEPDTAFTTTALARLRLTGAPWLKRTDRVASGIAGDSLGTPASYVEATTIGTQDSTRGVPYQPPPGVAEQTEEIRTGLDANAVQVNERSLRLLAGVPGGELGVYERAEAYLRFAEGAKNFMTYRTMRLWMRGRGDGWGVDGELNAYVKLGRDEHNFYMYRTPVTEGQGREAWLPEIRVDFERFFRLRAAVQEAAMRGGVAAQYQCTGADAELVRRSGLPRGFAVNRYAACDAGYMVYTIEPNVTPPNLAAVQELAVGLVRVRADGRGPKPILPNDTLELWVDDVRLSDVEATPGMAGEIGIAVHAGDLADVRVNLSRRDPHFRQLGEAPSFVSSNQVDVGTSVRLERLLPGLAGFALPLTLTYASADAAPQFLANSDVRASSVTGLRAPRDATTSVTLTVRRSTPLPDVKRLPFLAPLVNNVALTSTWISGANRSSYQDARRRSYSLRADYDLAPTARALGLPIGTGPLRWSPTQLRFTSHLVRTGNRQESFLRPGELLGDTARVQTGLDHVWRNGGTLAFQPLPSLTARWDATTLRDLRDYADGPGFPGDSIDRGAIARGERARLAGLDVGLERERGLTGLLRFAPAVRPWLRPRADLATYYTMTRDPNARTLLRETDLFGDTLSPFRFPQRLASTQVTNVGTALDIGRALLDASGRATADTARAPAWKRRVARVLQPMDVSVSRTLTSSFDNTALDPGLGFQLGFGGIGTFRAPNGREATLAGVVDRLTITNGLALPLGFTVAHRFETGDTRNWWRRTTTGGQAEGTGAVRTLPDLTVRWTWKPGASGSALWGLVSNVGANARLLSQWQTTAAPADSGAPADARASRLRSTPLSASITWAALGGLTTAGGVNRSRRVDDVPGSRTQGTTRETNVELTKAFRPPPRWNLKSDVRTRMGWQRSGTETLVVPRDLLGGIVESSALRPIVQADLGREALSFSANADVAEQLTFSLNGTRVVSFNRNVNSRVSQTVLSAVLQLNFFSGALH